MKNLKKILCTTLAAALVLTSAAVPTFAAAKPAISQTKLTLSVGEQKTLTVKNASKVTWSSKNKSVATVSKKGKVVAKAAGKTVISAKIKNVKKALTCKVTVKEAAKDITALLAGKSYKGTAEAMGTSMDALALSFDANGNVTGKMLDTESLTMKDVAGTYTATLSGKTVTITVKGADGSTTTETLTVVKDDFSELSATKNVSGMSIPVKVVEVTA